MKPKGSGRSTGYSLINRRVINFAPFCYSIFNMSTKNYDLIVIGSGAGLNVASFAHENYSWKVALIEPGPLGGTCLNRGCIPSKIIIHAADVAEEIRGAERFGIKARIESIDFAAVTNRASHSIDDDSAQIEQGIRETEGMDLYKVEGSFVDEHTLKVGGEEISGERILIAAGARPFVPPIDGIGNVDYMTSTEALRQTKQPKSMIVIGGGYIAAELGHFYGALGTKVTIVEMSPMLINREDGEISREFTRIFSEKHSVILGVKAKKISQNSDGAKVVTIEMSGGQEVSLEGEALLMAVGIKPNTDLLKVENAGIEIDKRGYIVVDEYMQTKKPHIWAIGDITGIAPFRHAANWQAQFVAQNIKGEGKVKVDHSVMPHAIFSSPQVAGVGLTEEQAGEKGIKYKVSKYYYKNTGMGFAMAEVDGFVKFILDPTDDKILGCHILGPQASILVHEVVPIMAAGGTASVIRNAIHIHPALSEVIRRAL